MNGFTLQQLAILNQQLRMHVQLSTQTFLQTYGHPALWKKADVPKNYMVNLEKKKNRLTIIQKNLKYSQIFID